jgi:metallophosphoesterase (TIGR00282 family)
LKILFIGDVCGRAGRRAVASLLPVLVERHGIDFAIANAENTAGGIGVTQRSAEELLSLEIDVLTSGNHVWRNREALPFIETCGRLLRPANYPPGAPGRGSGVFETRSRERVAVLNLQGRVFMQNLDCPFRVGDRELDRLKGCDAIVVDMHAEATAEKQALGWYMAGRASAVLGTHTHVQTADERILNGHTAYISDVGMTGPIDSVIGMKRENSLSRFLTQLPQRFEPAAGPTMLCGVVVEVGAGGAASSITRIAEPAGEGFSG